MVAISQAWHNRSYHGRYKANQIPGIAFYNDLVFSNNRYKDV